MVRAKVRRPETGQKSKRKANSRDRARAFNVSSARQQQNYPGPKEESIRIPYRITEKTMNSR
jgi:hypothetical protein